jgi:hypothetical protein
MALVRVVSFDGVTKDRLAALEQQLKEGDRPEGLSPQEIIVLHDADTEKSLTLIFFANEADYRRGDEILSAMDRGDTPGERTSVTKYDVAIRMTPSS